jgi:Arc/MetJ-type ribon-helix-helix transcriptional regulator
MSVLEACNIVQVEKEMPRIRVFATIREDVLRWVDQQVDRARFRNRSHAIEYALIKLMENEKKE